MPDALRVPDTARYPHSAIVRVVAIHESGAAFFGTGAVIGPNDVLTARHLVEDDPILGRVVSVEVVPGAQGDAEPFGAFFASEWRWPRRDNDGSRLLYPDDAATDFALLTVEDPTPIGLKTGWFGYASPDLAPGETLLLNTAGFPAGPQLVDTRREQPDMIRRHDVDRFDGLLLIHDEFSETGVYGGGSSGSPFWTYQDGARSIVGVLSTSDWAAYITPEIEAQIRIWATANGDGDVVGAGAAGAPRDGPEGGGGSSVELPLRPANADRVLLGGPGSDWLIAGDGDDAVEAGDGRDVVKTGSGADWVAGCAGHDFVLSGTGDDTIFGGAGDDTLKAHLGDDLIDAGAGDDVILAGDGDDVIFAGDGADLVKTGRGGDSVLGGAGDDFLLGFRGADFLDGGSGDDIIKGGLDDDTLIGGAGDDRLVGGPGRDVFVFGPAEIGFDATGAQIVEPAAFGRDRIIDFQIGSDLLDFSGSGIALRDLAFREIDGKAVLHAPASDSTLVLASLKLSELLEDGDPWIAF